MPTLLEKIEANAADRLRLPANRHPHKELARYKNFLKVESHRLQILHRAGAGGREICHARAAVLDALLRHILEGVRQITPDDKSSRAPLALVAIGGYGRGELNPNSDLDIMFLHDGELVYNGKPKPYMAALTDGLLYTLWDIGLKVGHSVRSVDDCVRVANSDMQSKTSLIEARLVTGDQALFERMQAVVLAKCVRGFEESYISARLEDQETRRAKFGNSASMQEPNVKNGSGGLRDYQNLLWMAFFKYRVRSLRELQERDLITESERKQLDAAYDFLLRLRNELHYQVKRAVDVMPKNLQPAMATSFGFTDRSPRHRLEKFMRQVYTHMRNIYLMTRTLEQRLAFLPHSSGLLSLRKLLRQGRLRMKQQVVDGFKIVDGQIHATSARIFREQPRRLMRVFLHAQQRSLKLHPDLEQMIRNQLSLVDRSFVRDPHVHETFLEIINQPGNVGRILRAMHDVDFLGKFLPEFGRLTCLVQHEFYHQYTADEHTLVCIEKLDQVWGAKEPPGSSYAELFRKVERPFLLYLALLLHDAGKGGEEDDHSEAGAHLAGKVAKRLGLDGATTHALRLIIEHHLTMSQISQRRDLEDPAVIQSFANQIQTVENLTMLTLHTFVDSQGTSAQLWNGFKDSLLWMLHRKTLQMLAGGPEFLRIEETQRDLLAKEVRRLLPRSIHEDEIKAHFDHLPSRYFQIHGARDIATDVSMAHRFMHLQLDEEDKALEPVVHWHNEPDRGYTSVTICTWDRAGMFSKIAGALSAAGLNILSAQIFTRSDGFILDSFFVTDAQSGALAKKEEKEKFERILRDALTEDVNLPTLIAKRRLSKPPYRSLENERIPTRIRFDNETSDQYTLLEIETEDRLGLLYVISQILSDLDIDISLAKVLTEKGAAIDSFYVVLSERGKLVSPEYQEFVADQLRAGISSLDEV